MVCMCECVCSVGIYWIYVVVRLLLYVLQSHSIFPTYSILILTWYIKGCLSEKVMIHMLKYIHFIGPLHNLPANTYIILLNLT